MWQPLINGGLPLPNGVDHILIDANGTDITLISNVTVEFELPANVRFCQSVSGEWSNSQIGDAIARAGKLHRATVKRLMIQLRDEILAGGR